MKKLITFLAAIFLILSYSCNSPEKSFKKALASRLIKDFNIVIKKYPESEFSKKAKIKVADIESWAKIDSSLISSDYKAYLDSFSDALFRNEANNRLKEISLFDSVRKNDIIKDYKSFQEKYPQSLFNDIIIERIEALKPAQIAFDLAQRKMDVNIFNESIIEFSNTGYAKLMIPKLNGLNKVYYGSKGVPIPDLISHKEANSFALFPMGRLEATEGNKFLFVSLTFYNGLKDKLSINLDSVSIKVSNESQLCTASGIFPYHFSFESQAKGIKKNTVPSFKFPNGVSRMEQKNNLVEISGFRHNSASFQFIFEVPVSFVFNAISWYGRDILDSRYNKLQTIALANEELDAVDLAITNISEAVSDITIRDLNQSKEYKIHDLKVNQNLRDRLSKYSYDQIHEILSIHYADINFYDWGVEFKVNNDENCTAEYRGALNAKIQFTQGNFGMRDGNIYIVEGTEINVNNKNYRYRYITSKWISSECY